MRDSALNICCLFEKQPGEESLNSSPIELNCERQSEEGCENVLKKIAAASKVNIGVSCVGEDKNEQTTQNSRVY